MMATTAAELGKKAGRESWLLLAAAGLPQRSKRERERL
jgi:hypothetical protein